MHSLFVHYLYAHNERVCIIYVCECDATKKNTQKWMSVFAFDFEWKFGRMTKQRIKYEKIKYHIIWQSSEIEGANQYWNFQRNWKTMKFWIDTFQMFHSDWPLELNLLHVYKKHLRRHTTETNCVAAGWDTFYCIYPFKRFTWNSTAKN